LTPDTRNVITPEQRLMRLEDPAPDFPFYRGAPAPISGPQWLFVMAAVVLGFIVLGLPVSWPGGAWGAMIPALLFSAIPLAALAYVVPGHWRAIFGKVGLREVKLMIGFALLTLLVSMIVGVIVSALVNVTSNAAAAQLAAMDTAARIAFFAKTLPQLLGEEVMTLLPFLALLYVLSQRFGISRQRAIIVAWLISSVMFGMAHLPTYDWNWVQCIFVIGTARLVLTLPWILTKNIWVSTGAHIMNDWLLFSVGLLGASLAAKA
jgi:membrane protease YdiL (CAAX protease family)